MRVITKITRQKNNAERYNIFLDGEYAFPVDEAVLIKFELTKDKMLTNEEIGEINYEDEIRKAFNRALHFLSFRMRSEHEVKEKLKDDFGEAVILEAIVKLKDYGFLNDEAFATAFMNTKKNAAKQGPRAIAQDLKRKGINDQTREAVLDEFGHAEQVEIATQLAQKVARSEQSKTPAQVKQKIRDNLMRKGYSFEVITDAIAATEITRDDDDWDTMIEKQGDKIWDKYARKATGYELKMKVKQALYQKGFPSDIIDTFIEQKESAL